MNRYIARTLCSLMVAGMVSGLLVKAQDAKPDDQGYIRDWLMLAPVPLFTEGAGGDEIIKEQVPSEAKLKPKSGEKVKFGNKELTWKTIQSKKNSLDINDILASQNENVAAYMVAYLVCEKTETDVTLLMGSNDQGRVYLNGKEVLKSDQARPLEVDSDKAEHLTLNAGVNVLIFKIINETNNWEGSIRFKDRAGKPLTGLTVKLAP